MLYISLSPDCRKGRTLSEKRMTPFGKTVTLLIRNWWLLRCVGLLPRMSVAILGQGSVAISFRTMYSNLGMCS
jgi:hypothetical protein